MNLRDRRWDPERDEPAALWDRLNEAWRDLATAFRSMPTLTIRTQDFDGPIPSLTSKLSGTTRPIGVILVSLMDLDTNGTAAVTYSWTWADGEIASTSFSGIAAGKYRMRLLIIGGA